MKKCPKCNLGVKTYKKTCPLCGEILENDGVPIEVVSYPNHKVQIKKKNVFLRITLFILLVSSIASAIVNYSTFEEFPNLWSIIVISSSIYAWILIRNTIMSKGLMASRLVILSITTTLLFIIIDLVSVNDYKVSWSLYYIFPFITIASTLTILFILCIKKMKFRSYLMHLFASIFIGFIPLILMLCGFMVVGWPSLSSGGLSLATLLGLFIFADSETKSEIKKRFHI